jgi:DNA-nicking Smr family endonuclease
MKAFQSLPGGYKAMKKDKDLFNPAFKNLNKKIKTSPDSGIESEPKEPKENKAEPGDENHFTDAMADVTPLPGEKTRIIHPSGPHVKPSHPAPDDEQETMAHLSGLVRGSVELDITFSDEYIEGSVKGFSPKLMRRLKRGQFPVQDYIDLHGMTRQEAETEVKEFLLESHRLGLRCVLIVHGRGLNSPESLPVLKEGLPIWLNRGPIKKIVIAFATAKPYDGGTGAIYVLLKRR